MRTTKQFLVVTFFMLCLLPVFAQSNFGEVRWGLKGGVNFASVNNLGNIERDKGKVGVVGGGFLKVPLKISRKLFVSVRPELLFNMKGASLNLPKELVPGTDTYSFALNYVELPISLDFDLPFFLDIHAGVQGSYLVSKKLKINDVELENDDEFENSEFGWHIGTGIDLGNLGIHVRFQQSLNSFYTGFFYGDGDIGARNWGVSLTGSYMFP